jgi:hypothetical protein
MRCPKCGRFMKNDIRRWADIERYEKILFCELDNLTVTIEKSIV